MITALSRDDGPAFGAHAFIRAGDWSREGAERGCSDDGRSLGLPAGVSP